MGGRRELKRLPLFERDLLGIMYSVCNIIEKWNSCTRVLKLWIALKAELSGSGCGEVNGSFVKLLCRCLCRFWNFQKFIVHSQERWEKGKIAESRRYYYWTEGSFLWWGSFGLFFTPSPVLWASIWFIKTARERATMFQASDKRSKQERATTRMPIADNIQFQFHRTQHLAHQYLPWHQIIN